jgi:hypothetical protein
VLRLRLRRAHWVRRVQGRLLRAVLRLERLLLGLVRLALVWVRALRVDCWRLKPGRAQAR